MLCTDKKSNMLRKRNEGVAMSKEQEIHTIITQLQIGEPIRIPTNGQQYVVIERVFEGWILDYQNERYIYRMVEDTVQFLAGIWNTDLKKVIKLQYSELGEIEDLGEY